MYAYYIMCVGAVDALIYHTCQNDVDHNIMIFYVPQKPLDAHVYQIFSLLDVRTRQEQDK